MNGERLTPEVEPERGKVTTWGEADGGASKHSAATPLVRSWMLGARSLKIGATLGEDQGWRLLVICY